jgi:DNA polymerase elongation subunit (family B)
MSYRNAYYDPKGRSVYVHTWDENGERTVVRHHYSPYLYIEHSDGEGQSIFKTGLRKKSFGTAYERYKYTNDVSTNRFFENLPPVQQFLVDEYWKHNEDEDFSIHPIKCVFLDIETQVDDTGFPNIHDPQQVVNVVTLHDSLTNIHTVFGIGPYKNNDPDVKYVQCDNEEQLFQRFILYFEKDYPDIISAWNLHGFDLPYLIARGDKIVGRKWMERLSPSRDISCRDIITDAGMAIKKWTIRGVSVLDYLEVYKQFSPGEKENYKLDTIGELELGQKKIDYGDISIGELARTNWQKFVEYNIQDVRLLVNLEEKLNYFGLARMLAYTGLTTFEQSLGAISVINGSAAIQARRQGQIIPTFKRNEQGRIPGAYVGEPQDGFHENVISFDANSLYPNVMISLNMSPETKLGKILSKTDECIKIQLINGTVHELTPENFVKFVKKHEVGISKANIMFSQKNLGLMPKILQYNYDKRVVVKKEMQKLRVKKAEMEKSGADKDEIRKVKHKIEQLDAKQLCIKIFINSIYGYFANSYAPMGDRDIGMSITLTGQGVIKQANQLIKDYIKEQVPDVDELALEKSVIYNDTDSTYASIKALTDHQGIKVIDEKDNKQYVTQDGYDAIQKVEDYLNVGIKKWGAKALNSKNCSFVFKREVIASVGVFTGKKRYVLRILDDEGIACDKFKYKGVEVVRSTMPVKIKPYAKDIIETMLRTQSIQQTNRVLSKAYDDVIAMDVKDIASISGIHQFEKYIEQCDGFKTCKGMPMHAKAAYYHNLLLDRFDIASNYEKIQSGDKVRTFYVQKPNRYNIDCLGFKYDYPKEFKDNIEIDYNIMFEKVLFQCIRRFYETVHWPIQKPDNQTKTSLLELLG